MLKITRTEGMVLLILTLMPMCLFNVARTRASGEGPSLISVIINGVEVTHEPSAVVEARLRTSLTVNVTWSMLYTPGIQYGWMQISLYNNVTKIENSTRYTDRGTVITKIWTCLLDPGDWTLGNYKEYGHVEITLLRYDGVEIFSNTTRYTICILPEQLDLTLKSYTLMNDSDGRMEHLNASYNVTSKQDPCFLHTGLQFTCVIFDAANDKIHSTDSYVNSLGLLDVIIDREYLIYMEGQTMKITNQATMLIEPISIEVDMESIVNRTDFLLYYRNLTETSGGENVSIIINIEAASFVTVPGVSTLPLYFEWTAFNGTGIALQNGTSYAYLWNVTSVHLDPRLTPLIEQLTIDFWFEGNFLFRSKRISLQLRDQLFREEIDVILMNQAVLLANKVEDLCFQLNVKQTGIPIPNHLVRASIFNETTGLLMISHLLQTDGDGCMKISLSPAEIHGLEHILIQVQVPADLAFKQAIRSFSLGEIFIRAIPVLRINNKSTSVTLHADLENMLSLSIFADGNESFFMNRLVKLIFRDEMGATILAFDSIIGPGGSVSCAIPVSNLRAGQIVFISVTMDATLTNQALTSIIQLQVLAIIESRETTTIIAIMSTIIMIAAMIGVMIALKCVQKARHNFLSKDQFTIRVA